MDLCDLHSHSWFGWLWNTWQPLVKEIRRVYAERVAGKVVRQAFSKKTKVYELEYYAEPSAGSTRIFIDIDLHYKEGYFVECHPRCSVQVGSDPKRLTLDSANFE